MIERNKSQYYELAACALGYSEDEFLDMVDDGTIKTTIRREVINRLNVSFDGFVMVVDSLLPLTPTIHHNERNNIIHAFVRLTNNGERPQILVSVKNKVNYSVDRLD